MNLLPIPQPPVLIPPKSNEIALVASGNLKQVTNRATWQTQAEMEARLSAVLESEGYTIHRAHDFDPALGHGYIWNQRMGMDVFKHIHPDTRIIVAEAAWQFSQNILAGLRDHRGPILTVANWSGRWPGLVGLLNLNACLVKAKVPYSTIWSENFSDDFFLCGLRQWLRENRIDHNSSHVRPFDLRALPNAEAELGIALARYLRYDKAVMGVFDEGCMGMYNAIIDDELLNPLGIYKERLSQSALVAAMRRVGDAEARGIRQWLEDRGFNFITGMNEEIDLTDRQIHEQCKMYIAALRIAHEFGCATIGIQYSSGLKDMTPASDLAEGLFNNPHRPPVFDAQGNELYANQALPHFNEADEGAAVDLLVNNRVWTALGLDPSTTLHDIRWGEHYTGDGIDDFVWVFMISGAVPASHLIGGYAGAMSVRQPPVSFPLGGGTLKGISKPGEIVWSRVFIENDQLHADLGRGHVVALPQAETERRWQSTTPPWPLMSAVLHGVTRDQMMARHRSNHIIVAYAPDARTADQALMVKAAMLSELGIQVHLCGRVGTWHE